MIPSRRGALLSVIASFGLFAALGPANAQDVYAGKTINVLVGGTAGGGFDTISRIMANHLGRYIPGEPTFVVRDMPGGGGIVVANHTYNVAPKDGTTIAYVGPVVVQPLLSPGDKRIQFDAKKFTWIGSLGLTHSILFAWHKTPFKTAQDLFQREMVVGGTGAASTTDIYPKVLNAVLGTKFKLITGYQGTKETLIAIERGEADGRFNSWDSMKTTSGQWLRDGLVRILLQAATKRHPELPDVPTALELAKTDDQRQALEFLFLPADMGRPIAAPPGIPADRKAILVDGFAKLVKDKAFLADAKKAGLEVDGPMTSDEVIKTVDQIYATPNDVVQKVAKAMQ
jgi:tripartite-type tricarboxylate transporter receptor subunit TctC